MEPEPGLAEHAGALADGIDATIATWVVRSVVEVHTAWACALPAEVLAAAERAGQAARDEVGPAVRALLSADVDEQITTPLSLLRGAVSYPTGVLAAAGVPPVERDRFAEEAFPHDPYDLTPANLAALDPALAEPALVWGAAKAWEHRRRHRP